MAQLNVYVPDSVVKEIRREAKRAGSSLSRYIGRLLERRVEKPAKWPKGFFRSVVGQWQGSVAPIDRPPPDEQDAW